MIYDLGSRNSSQDPTYLPLLADGGFGAYDTDGNDAFRIGPDPVPGGDLIARADGFVIAADTPGDTTTTTTIAVGEILYDQLENATDHDWIAIDLTAGQSVSLILNGFGGDGVFNPTMTLRDDAGTALVTNNDTYSTDARIDYTATAGGTYYVDVSSFSGFYFGNYQLQAFASTSTTDTIAGDSSTGEVFALGGSYHGVLETAGDSDWIAVDLVAGQEYSFISAAVGSSPSDDIVYSIRDSGGSAVASAQYLLSTGGSYGIFTVDNSGTYYIDVSSSNSTAGEYRFTILETYSIDQIADQLTQGYWGYGVDIFWNVTDDNTITVNIDGLSADGQFLARTALQLWSDVTGIQFSETSASADMTFQNTAAGAYASIANSGTTITSATVNVSSAWIATYGTGLDSYSFQTYIHEIGHALGLGHGGDYNGGADYMYDALYANDSWATTVMSYFDETENLYFAVDGFDRPFVTTPMAADVVAITNLYGSATDTRLGDTTYGFNSTAGNDLFDATQFGSTAYTIVDSGGRDTLDYSGFADNQLIDLASETFMNIGGLTGNITIGRGTRIENAISGSGADTINGNGVGNELTGNAGNDVIAGLAGRDTISGDAGDDTLSGGTQVDTIHGGAGIDIITGGNGADALYGEDDADTISGGGGGDTIDGGLGDDDLSGGAGADTIDGGEGLDTINGNDGGDDLVGGLGNDIINGGQGNDAIDGGDGDDTIQAGAGADSVFGGADADHIFGQDGADTIDGEGGNDQLDGGGGDDGVSGGEGNDTISGGGGQDTIDGGAGDDTIYGSFGADTLTGGTGADIFVFDSFLANYTADTITDFEAGDAIWLDRTVFAGLAAGGTLSADAFVLGSSAQDADDRIIYDSSTGELFYDADGSGATDAVLFATVTAGTSLSEADFVVLDTAGQDVLASAPATAPVAIEPLAPTDMFTVA